MTCSLQPSEAVPRAEIAQMSHESRRVVTNSSENSMLDPCLPTMCLCVRTCVYVCGWLRGRHWRLEIRVVAKERLREIENMSRSWEIE